MPDVNFERVMHLQPDEVVNAIGDLYKFEGDVPTEIADRVEEMTKLQDDISELMNEVAALANAYQDTIAENQKLKATNTKLMYDSIRRNPEPTPEEKEKDVMETAEEIAENIDIYDED